VGREYRSSSVSYSEDAKVELFLLEVDSFDYTRPVQLSCVEYHTTDALPSNLDPAYIRLDHATICTLRPRVSQRDKSCRVSPYHQNLTMEISSYTLACEVVQQLFLIATARLYHRTQVSCMQDAMIHKIEQDNKPVVHPQIILQNGLQVTDGLQQGEKDMIKYVRRAPMLADTH
jgi:hypothetical protein